VITQCCIHELYLQGRSMQPVVDLAKTFERRKCNHKEAIPGDDCICTIVGMPSESLTKPLPHSDRILGDSNKHRYVVTTQSQQLRQKLRNTPAVPVVHMNRSVMILEPMSETTAQIKARVSVAPRHFCDSACLSENTG
jgi:U3 small nucleolar RNA-associated protein 23